MLSFDFTSQKNICAIKSNFCWENFVNVLSQSPRMREVRPVCLGWAASDARLTMLRCGRCGAGAGDQRLACPVRRLGTAQTGRGGFTGLRNASQSASANGKPKMPNNIKQSRENSLKSIKTRYFLLCLFSMIWTANSMRAVSLVRTWKLEKPCSYELILRI